MISNSPLPCDHPSCRKIAGRIIGGNFGRYGRLVLAACEAHEPDMRKQMRKTMVWGSFPLDIFVEEVKSFW
jgi:hypothetical protein